MARLSLSKSTLSELIRQLKTYQNFLPSLDLKRRQLLAEQEKARRELQELTHREEAHRPMVEKQVPMLRYTHVDARGIVRVSKTDVVAVNGMRIPLAKLCRL